MKNKKIFLNNNLTTTKYNKIREFIKNEYNLSKLPNKKNLIEIAPKDKRIKDKTKIFEKAINFFINSFNNKIDKEKKEESAPSQLSKIKTNLDGRTAKAFERKISNKKNEKKIVNELKQFKANIGDDKSKFNISNIRLINKTFKDVKSAVSNNTKHKIDLEKLRETGLKTQQIIQNILRLTNEKKYLLTVGNVKYTLNNISRQKLLERSKTDFIVYDEGATSDEQVMIEILTSNTLTLEPVFNFSTYNSNEGSFFKYYCKNFELERFGIYKNKNCFYNEIDKVCLVKALRIGGLNDVKYEALKRMVKGSSIPFSKLGELCTTLEIQIKIKRERQRNPSRDIFGKEYNEVYFIGLLDNHYFIIEEVEYRKDMEDYLEKDLSLNYQKKKVNSYHFIKFLLEHKNHFLIKIPYEDLESTVFYKLIDDDIETLEYHPNCCINFMEERKEKKQIDFFNVFFDFETYTNSKGFHIPYLVCIRYQRNKNNICIKSFIGEDCGYQMLLYINKAIDTLNIQLIAHNATYDYQFLVKYLYQFHEIKRGSRMLTADGKFFKKNIKIKCSYHLISSPLSKFGKMFKLTQEKEIMPYELYNEDFNIFENRMISINKVLNENDKNGHPFLKEKDKEDFLINIEKWNLNKNGFYDIIEYSKKYCEIDCEVLMNGYNIFKGWILELKNIETDESLNLNIDNIITAASLAHQYMILNNCYEGVYELGGTPQQFIQQCVVGGRTMSNNNQPYNINNGERIADLDGVSLYPSSMVRIEGFLKGLPKVIQEENLNYEWIKNQDGFFVEIKIINFLTSRSFSLFSYKTKEGIRMFDNNMFNKNIFVDKTTLEDLITFQGVEFEIIKGYYFNEGFNKNVNKTINFLFETRKKKKKEKNPIETIYKLIMNSCYGKTILKEQTTEVRYFHNENDFKVYLDRNYDRIITVVEVYDSNIKKVETISSIHNHRNFSQVGVCILSMSKRIMNETMCLSEDNNIMMFYQDTDSIHMYQKDISKVAELYKQKYNRELIGEDLGQFHSDFEIKGCKDVYSSHLIVLGKKCYVDRLVGTNEKNEEVIDYHIRLKGVPNSTIEYEIKKRGLKNPIELYQLLYKGKTINFDLTEGKGKSRFKIQKNFGVKTLDKFDRNIGFNNEDGIIRSIRNLFF
jgi:hypothetical protein